VAEEALDEGRMSDYGRRGTLRRWSTWAVSTVGLLAVSVVLIAAYELYVSPPRPVPDGETVEVIIPAGLPANEIGTLLEKEGVIGNAGTFLLLGKLGRYERRLQAGRYRLSPMMRDLDVLKVLTRGGTGEERVTLPEGLTVAQVAEVLVKHAGIDRERFLGLARDPSVAESLRVPASRLEGYLFPDTYNIFWRMDERQILSLMVEDFWAHFGAARRERAAALGMTVHEVITLASLIEKEAKIDDERSLISGVFHNRLALGRPLESCATVGYILPERRERLTYADLSAPSPYNTYLHVGLPPGPICNPGIASVDAALYPAQTKYLYFVSRGNGTHEFTRTASEHYRAKQRYEETP
jgi:UPF0755 protein